MQDKQGVIPHDRKAIADLFADFYEELYASREQAEPLEVPQTTPVPPFTMRELIEGLKTLKSKKCADTAGIRAEMLKIGGEHLLSKLLELYNMILSGNTHNRRSRGNTQSVR